MQYEELLSEAIKNSQNTVTNSIFSDTENQLSEQKLLEVNFKEHLFITDNGPFPFEELLYVFIQKPVFESLDEFADATGSSKYSNYKIEMKGNFSIKGQCLTCDNENGVWKILRLHKGHVFIVLVSEQNVSDIKLIESNGPSTFGIDTADQELHNGVEEVRLQDINIDEHWVRKFPSDLLFKYQALPLRKHGHFLEVAFSNPKQIDAIQTLSFIAGCNIEPKKADKKELLEYLSGVVQFQNEKEALSELEKSGITNKTSLATNEIESLGKKKGVISLMATIITDAIEKGASDIHLHPRADHLELLFRIDGTLTPVRKLNLSLHPALVSRVKIIGGMDISERRLPQDGRIEYSGNNKSVDMRISIMPTVYGESVVIRILDSSQGLRDIKEIGLNTKDTEKLTNLLRSSYGIFLVTGPTGSGKTTTLYAALQEKVKEGPHIVTVEEPVEYKIDGVTQIPVNHKIGYTFARALRNILRHDPDVIMVGEIRDDETAKIAVESALTGHLVLSTLHTNSAVSTITRLIEMGVEPYLLKDALVGILAQRLVKKNCPLCLEKEEVPDSIRHEIQAKKNDTFYRGAGCSECFNTGIAGRRSVYELLTITPDISREINESLDIEKLAQKAEKQGMVRLADMALDLARNKEISAFEVYKIRANASQLKSEDDE
ncbi:GspE/PulE family protein [Kangiella sediminilitoris]|uniref:Type II secretion system protein E n=1 Tax=Kangiella sediminilitoris TaxID=1144748 RepID=A0A1B3BAS4_9GAMM|nr:GspE/PulE family protein [Kangiella sediminilitoris]AOE49889.1 Type II secretion system protein E [Kangiella sediminilitoris]